MRTFLKITKAPEFYVWLPSTATILLYDYLFTCAALVKQFWLYSKLLNSKPQPMQNITARIINVQATTDFPAIGGPGHALFQIQWRERTWNPPPQKSSRNCGASIGWDSRSRPQRVFHSWYAGLICPLRLGLQNSRAGRSVPIADQYQGRTNPYQYQGRLRGQVSWPLSSLGGPFRCPLTPIEGRDLCMVWQNG